MNKKVEKRNYVIDEIINLIKIVYNEDEQMNSFMMEMSVILKTNDSEEFLNDIHGFLLWSEMTDKSSSYTLCTIIHDLAEFRDNRNKDWFCPRTSGYNKYMTGASNKEV